LAKNSKWRDFHNRDTNFTVRKWCEISRLDPKLLTSAEELRKKKRLMTSSNEGKHRTGI